MKINRDELLYVNGIYISQLYSNWYAAECIVLHGGRVMKVRYPYINPENAFKMVAFLNRRRDDFPVPDYKIEIQLMNKQNSR